MDKQNAEDALKYFEIDSKKLQDCRECILVKDWIGHIEDRNVDGFDETVNSYNSVSGFDYWFTIILQRIKT